jgi:alanine racemase
MRFSSELVVDLTLLQENFQKLKKLARNNQIIFMVKANAYGHGLIDIVKFSSKNLGVKFFGCASLGEALEIKREASDPSMEIFVFSDLALETHLESYRNSNIFPVLSSLSQLKLVIESGVEIPIVLKINTGMNRLGINDRDYNIAIDYLKQNEVKSIKHLMTHFSNSFFKIKEGDKTHRQYSKFLEFKKLLSNSKISLESSSVSNSGAIEQKFGLDETHIRPGLMLYGARSVGSLKNDEIMWDGKIISSLNTKVISIEAVNKGTPIGYGGHTCHADGIIAFLPLGYGDGILTYYSGANIYHNGAIGKIIGRVNMDITAVHFSKEDANKIKVGDKVEFWNHTQNSVVEFATQTNSIPYQMFTSITSRVPRRYIY